MQEFSAESRGSWASINTAVVVVCCFSSGCSLFQGSSQRAKIWQFLFHAVPDTNWAWTWNLKIISIDHWLNLPEILNVNKLNQRKNIIEKMCFF